MMALLLGTLAIIFTAVIVIVNDLSGLEALEVYTMITILFSQAFIMSWMEWKK